MVAGDRVCKRCGAPIAWVVTANGHSMPVNAGADLIPGGTFDPNRHVSHFATCPFAGAFRKHHQGPKRPPRIGGHKPKE